MTDSEIGTIKAELSAADAERNIAKAVSARHSIARKYLMWIRRKNPEATPAEIIQILEAHYGTAITTAGAVISVAAIAADVGISMIPIAGAAAAGMKSAGQQAAKKAGKEVAKAAVKKAAKDIALGTSKNLAQKAVAFLPAGDEQLQFEITAIFGLAIADIHGMNLDQDQAQALVLGLSNERVSQQNISIMASDVARTSEEGLIGVEQIVEGRTDWSHWASTLADTLPGGAAKALVQTIQTGQLVSIRENLSDGQQAVVEYGVGALAGGVTRFLFGREVVEASRVAFPPPPEDFPANLAVPLKTKNEEGNLDIEGNQALAALEDAAKATGNWIYSTANIVGDGVVVGAAAVGSGVASAAGVVSRPFQVSISMETGFQTSPKHLLLRKTLVVQLPAGRVPWDPVLQGFSEPKSQVEKFLLMMNLTLPSLRNSADFLSGCYA
ncbi:MAG: hypothetical protein WBA28_05515 [Microbacteriaceae bacterium]